MRRRPAARLLVLDPRGRLLLFRFERTDRGEAVLADERLFLARVPAGAPSRAGWTALGRDVMTAHRWRTADELRATSETAWPDDLPRLLADARAW